MEFIKAMEIRQRMCGKYNDNCDNCPLSFVNNNRDLTCNELMEDYPAEAEKIFEDWDKAHPVKTILSDFLEKYPNAMLGDDGTPMDICPSYLGYFGKCKCKSRSDCLKCWNTPMEDKTE